MIKLKFIIPIFVLLMEAGFAAILIFNNQENFMGNRVKIRIPIC